MRPSAPLRFSNWGGRERSLSVIIVSSHPRRGATRAVASRPDRRAIRLFSDPACPRAIDCLLRLSDRVFFLAQPEPLQSDEGPDALRRFQSVSARPQRRSGAARSDRDRDIHPPGHDPGACSLASPVLALNEQFRGRAFLLAVVVLPWALSTYMAAVIWRHLLASSTAGSMAC